jgi:DNA-binding NarL/FixJ family response regulator
MSRLRVFLADDHTMLLDAFVKLLGDTCDIVGTATNGREVLDTAPAATPDIIVVDIAMPGLNGIDVARQLRPLVPDAKIIFLTQSDDAQVAAHALADGAAAYLLKECAGAELLTAIEAVRKGGTYITPLIAGSVLDVSRRAQRGKPALTDRQREVLQLIAEGRPMTDIAAILHITPRTVAHHKYKIMELVGAVNTAELVRYAIREGLVTQ